VEIRTELVGFAVGTNVGWVGNTEGVNVGLVGFNEGE
jgi:hypothetical protein